jgi:hypothetical protein
MQHLYSIISGKKIKDDIMKFLWHLCHRFFPGAHTAALQADGRQCSFRLGGHGDFAVPVPIFASVLRGSRCAAPVRARVKRAEPRRGAVRNDFPYSGQCLKFGGFKKIRPD